MSSYSAKPRTACPARRLRRELELRPAEAQAWTPVTSAGTASNRARNPGPQELTQGASPYAGTNFIHHLANPRTPSLSVGNFEMSVLSFLPIAASSGQAKSRGLVEIFKQKCFVKFVCKDFEIVFASLTDDLFPHVYTCWLFQLVCFSFRK